MAENEPALLQQYARTHDAFAFRALVEMHQNMVFAACHRVLGNRADAEDAAQNCFLKLAQAADRLKAPIGGWLHTVAVRAAIDMLRRRTVRRTHEHGAAVQARRTHVTEDAWADVQDKVDAAIITLPERLRTPIVLYFLEGWTQADVAAQLGIARQSAAKRLHRGVDALRRRLKRAGIVAPAVALTAMLSANTAEAAPVALTAALGRMALVGASGAKVAAVGGTLATLKTAVALVAAAGAGAGAVVIHHAATAPRPAPIAATAPVIPVMKKLRTPEEVLNAELTLAARAMRLAELGKLIKEQIGVRVTHHERVGVPFIPTIEPGTHKVRDVLAAITAAAPLTTEIVADGDSMVICFWPKEPDAQALAEMMKLAVSADVVERCTAARWLEKVGGRDALLQLLKMLADPDARVRRLAAAAIVPGWTDASVSPLSCTAPKGTGLALAKAIEPVAAAAPGTMRNMLHIADSLRDPAVLPALEKRLKNLEMLLKKLDVEADIPNLLYAELHRVCETIATIGGPEAEAILLAAVDRRPQMQPRVRDDWALCVLGWLGTDASIAQLRKSAEARPIAFRFSAPLAALKLSESPAIERELIRILNQPGLPEHHVRDAVLQLAKYRSPEAQTICVEKFKAMTLPEDQLILAQVPAVREMLFGELAQGGAVARRAALLLAPTPDPRLAPTLIKLLNIDAKTIRAEGLDRWAQRKSRVVGGRLVHRDNLVQWVERRAITSLARIGGPEAEKALIAVAKGRGEMASTTLLALGYSSSPEARDVLRDALENRERNALIRAVNALVKRPDPADIDFLLLHARKEQPEPAWALWKGVATIGGPRAAKELVDAAARGNVAAARALMASHDPHCVSAARDALAGNDAKLRAHLMSGSHIWGSDSALSAYYAVGIALAELRDADEKLRTERVTQLGWMQTPRGTDVLAKLLVDAEEPVALRRIAAERLASYNKPDPAALEPLRHAFEHDTDKEVKKHAERALMGWGIIPQRHGRRPRPPKDPVPKGPVDPTIPPDEREFPAPPEP